MMVSAEHSTAYRYPYAVQLEPHTFRLRPRFKFPTDQLSARSQFTVKLIRRNPFEFLIRDERLNLDAWYPEPLAAALAPYREHRQGAGVVQQDARAAAATAQWNTRSFLTALCLQIFSIFRRMTRGTVAADNRLAVAAALDSALAAPVMGTYLGGFSSTMEPSLWMQVHAREPGAPA